MCPSRAGERSHLSSYRHLQLPLILDMVRLGWRQSVSILHLGGRDHRAILQHHARVFTLEVPLIGALRLIGTVGEHPGASVGIAINLDLFDIISEIVFASLTTERMVVSATLAPILRVPPMRAPIVADVGIDLIGARVVIVPLFTAVARPAVVMGFD